MINAIAPTTEKTKITTNEQPTRICFVCTGNTCRSPMAEKALNKLGGGKYIAESAGIMADKGAPMTPNAVNALKKAGIVGKDENADHVARQINSGIIESCDTVVAVGAGHAMMLLQAFPHHASKITSFDCPIPDPYGKDAAAYDECLSNIIKCIKNMFVLPEIQDE